MPAPDGEARLTLEAAASGVAIAEGGDDPDRVTLEVSRLAEDKVLRDRAAARGRQGAERQSFDLVAKSSPLSTRGCRESAETDRNRPLPTIRSKAGTGSSSISTCTRTGHTTARRR